MGALTSESPGEEAWYVANLAVITVPAGDCRIVYSPELEADWPAGSPDGRWLAVAEGCASDRGTVAGGIVLVDVESATSRQVDTNGVAVTGLEWRDANTLFFAGQRDFEVVIGECSMAPEETRECWTSTSPSCGYWNPYAVPYSEGAFIAVTDDAILVCSRERSQEVKAVVQNLKEGNREEYL